MTSTGLEKKELLTKNCGCHGNLVTIAMRYVSDAYHPGDLDRCAQRRMGQCYFQLQNLTWLWASSEKINKFELTDWL